jgi:hypothetical protein
MTSFGQVASYPSASSTAFASACNDYPQTYAAIYPVYYNLMTNGAVALNPNPTVFLGDRTFFNDATVCCFASEEAESQNACLSIFHFFPAAVFGNLFNNAPLQHFQNRAQLFDYTSMEVSHQVVGDRCSWQLMGTFRAPPTAPGWPAAPVKYPFLCGGQPDEWGLLTVPNASGGSAPEEWQGIVANALCAHFTTPNAVAAGNAVCQALAKTYAHVPPLDAAGRPQPLLPSNPAVACSESADYGLAPLPPKPRSGC